MRPAQGIPCTCSLGWFGDLAVSNERLGKTEQGLQHPGEARAAFERALAIYEALLKSDPENTNFLVFSTVSLMQLGELDPNRSKSYFARALRPGNDQTA
jgi:hypothetical protein